MSMRILFGVVWGMAIANGAQPFLLAILPKALVRTRGSASR